MGIDYFVTQSQTPQIYPFGRIYNPTALNISILNAKQPLLRIVNPYIRGCRIANPTERVMLA